MDPESPKQPSDYIDWKRFRSTKEYQRFVVGHLRNSITWAKYPEWNPTNQSDEITDFNVSLRELGTVDQVREFCKTNKDPSIQAINIEAEIQKAEEYYPGFVAFTYEHGDEVTRALRKALGAEDKNEGRENKREIQ